MKRLILMRHAKSSWADPETPDRERPLNSRGQRTAGTIGAWLRSHDYLPEVALVSTAVRAQQTYEGVMEALDNPRMTPLSELYQATPQRMLDLLRAVPDAETVLIIGHQPGVGAFAQAILRDPPPDLDPERYPTAATLVADFDFTDWQDVDWGAGALRDLVLPRKLE